MSSGGGVINLDVENYRQCNIEFQIKTQIQNAIKRASDENTIIDLGDGIDATVWIPKVAHQWTKRGSCFKIHARGQCLILIAKTSAL
jgi:hypothetical protein